MKKLTLMLSILGAYWLGRPAIQAQADFGNRSTEMKEVAAYELARPNIPDIQVGDPPVAGPVARPVYLYYRYYSCAPWYPFYVRDVFSNVVGRSGYSVEVDTAGALQPGDNVDGQIVQDINHPAYGLYCIGIKVGIPWALWQPGIFNRFYIRWAYNAPYWCWIDHWWYYWQRPYKIVTLTTSQEVPPTTGNGTGTASLAFNNAGDLLYTITFSGLSSPTTQAHFHGPAGPGVNANILIPINIPLNVTSGTVSGTVTASGNPSFFNFLASGQVYINIHTQLNGGGEIRGQIPVFVTGPPIWCPYGPSWIPYLRWNRYLNTWGLTICHPYCYAWNPLYVPQPFCLYGLRYYYTPIGNIRQPAVDVASPFAVPLNNAMSLNGLSSKPWSIYNSIVINNQILRPFYNYWPFTPYCQRWYWYRCLPFTFYRYNPPCVQFATWIGTVSQPFPDAVVPELVGNQSITTVRAQVNQQGDLNGDGVVNAADQSSYRSEAGTQAVDSFFDVFATVE